MGGACDVGREHCCFIHAEPCRVFALENSGQNLFVFHPGLSVLRPTVELQRVSTQFLPIAVKRQTLTCNF